MSHNDKIFVSIAALEDPGLIDTIKDCLKKAKKPENIIFGIALTYETEPNLDFIQNQSRIIRTPMPDYNNQIGMGIIEIRNAIKRLHKDETYFLQIDAHANFEKNWDDILIHDINEMDDKTVISKQISELENKENHITQFRLIPETPVLTGSTVVNLDKIQKKLINENYFLNHYISCNFIFAKAKWLYEVPMVTYHRYPYEEQEHTIISYCYGYNAVSPLRKRQVVFAGTDPKYHFPRSEKWWRINKINPDDESTWQYDRLWISDNDEMRTEVEQLMLTGKNKYMSIENTARNIIDFYTDIGLAEEYKQMFSLLKGGNTPSHFRVRGDHTKDELVAYRLKKIDKYHGGDLQNEGF
jgi:hypothetical protein